MIPFTLAHLHTRSFFLHAVHPIPGGSSTLASHPSFFAPTLHYKQELAISPARNP